MRIPVSGIVAATIAAVLLPAAPAPAATAAGWAEAPPVPTPVGATGSVFRDVTVLSPTDVWAVGAWFGGTQHPLAVHWGADGWRIAPLPATPPSTDAYDLTAVDGVATDDVWAVGTAESADTEPARTSAVVLHSDGLAWGVVPTPADLVGSQSALTDVDMLTADDGWAVGRTAAGTAPSQPLILRRQAGRWSRVPAPATGAASALTSVFAGSADDAWAVGTEQRDGRQASLVLHWDGTDWAQVAVPDPAGSDDALESVSATRGEVWAVGSTCGAGGRSTCTPLVLHLAAGAWHVVPTGGGTKLTEVVPVSPTDVWVVGTANPVGSGEVGHAEHWDGRRFTVDPTVPADVSPRIGNGRPASALALSAAAVDKGSGVLWAVGWSQNPTQTPCGIFRGPA